MNRGRDVRAWLEYAEADHRSAYNAMRAADYRDVAFHCQQAVEKASSSTMPPVRSALRLWRFGSGWRREGDRD